MYEESRGNALKYSDPFRLASRAYLRHDAVHTLFVVAEDESE
jgi:hypothetical protein